MPEACPVCRQPISADQDDAAHFADVDGQHWKTHEGCCPDCEQRVGVLREALDRIGNRSTAGYVAGFDDPREYRSVAVFARDVLSEDES